jgi:hypothetical protein
LHIDACERQDPLPCREHEAVTITKEAGTTKGSSEGISEIDKKSNYAHDSDVAEQNARAYESSIVDKENWIEVEVLRRELADAKAENRVLVRALENKLGEEVANRREAQSLLHMVKRQLTDISTLLNGK